MGVDGYFFEIGPSFEGKSAGPENRNLLEILSENIFIEFDDPSFRSFLPLTVVKISRERPQRRKYARVNLLQILAYVCENPSLRVRFFKKIQDWILKSEKNPKMDFAFLY